MPFGVVHADVRRWTAAVPGLLSCCKCSSWCTCRWESSNSLCTCMSPRLTGSCLRLSPASLAARNTASSLSYPLRSCTLGLVPVSFRWARTAALWSVCWRYPQGKMTGLNSSLTQSGYRNLPRRSSLATWLFPPWCCADLAHGLCLTETIRFEGTSPATWKSYSALITIIQ